MVRLFTNANGCDCLQHLHRIVWSEFLKHRSADAGLRKDSEESGIRAADSIFFVNRSDGTNHSLDQLRCERTFALGFQYATTHLAKVSLHLPDRPGSYQGADKKSNSDPE